MHKIKVFSGGAWPRLCGLYRRGCVLIFLLMSSPALAAGGKPATKLVNVADTRMMESGPALWIANVYNENLWLYGLLVVVVMAGMGAVLGFGFDWLISRSGIDLGKLDHRE
ncbi:MAG TPA: DVU0150 family protein [bacterium]|nr:DVU0150 family protein [bacterium]